MENEGFVTRSYISHPVSDKKSFEEIADRQVKIRLALEEIVKLEKIEVSDEELTAEFEKMADKYKMELEKVKDLAPDGDIKKDLGVGKAIDFVKANAVISEVAAEKKSEDKPKPKKAAPKTTKPKKEAD